MAFSSKATNHYFSNAGNDATGTGTQANPYATITKLNSIFSTFSAGDSVLFRKGDTFVGSIIISKSGTLGNSIVISSYGTGANPVISGFTTVSSWSNLGSNIWESSSAVSTLSTCNVVSINGVNTAMGRTPNAGSYYNIDSYSGSTSITSSSLNSASINYTGATAVIRPINTFWINGTITSMSGSTINYTAANPTTPASANFKFFLQNAPSTLDQQNEWFYDKSTFRLKIYSTTTPSSTINATTQTDLIFGSGKSYITIQNIALIGANNDCINFQGTCNGISVLNCYIRFAGNDGIEMQNNSSGAIVRNCAIKDFGRAGIFIVGGTGSLACNNTVYNCGTILGQNDYNLQSIGIYISSTNSKIDSNWVRNSGSAGIMPYMIGECKYNYVDSSALNISDMGGIYQSYHGSGSTIDHNIVLNTIGNPQGSTRSEPNAEGIYLDEGDSMTVVTNNVAAYNEDYGFKLHSLTSSSGSNSNYNRIQNNLFYGNKNGQIIIANENSAHQFKSDTLLNNICFSNIATSLTAYFRDLSNHINTMGYFDSNYYVRPLDNGLIITSEVTGATTNRNLAQWQTYASPLDAHSKATPITIPSTSAGKQQLFYNPTFNDSSITLTGTFIDVANNNYSGTIVLHPFTGLALINTGSLTTTTINWSNPVDIIYGTALSSTQLNATVTPNVAGNFVYTPPLGTILNAGSSQNLSVIFNPSDPTSYTSSSKTVLINVNKATATLTATNTTQTYTGTQLSPTITTSPSGLTTINTTYNGLGSSPTNAGSYSCVTGLQNSNYTATSINYTFTINKATVVITISNTTQTYTGAPLPVTVTTNPNVSGISVTYNGSATVPTSAGTYTVVASLSNPNYQATNVTTTLTINKATPVITWANPSAITYGTALSGTQLNATSSVAGSFVYTPASGIVLNAGTYQLSTNFTPTDATDYNSVNNTTVTLVVNKATATITLSNLTQTYDGTPKPVTVTTSPVGLTTITTTYNGSTTVPSAVGSYSVQSTLSNSNYTASPATGTLVISTSAASIYITNYANLIYTGSQQVPTVTCAYSYSITYNGSPTAPTNVGSYTTIATINDGIHTGADTVTMTIIKATPVITWATPTNITYGTALSATQLNASTPIAGTFTYSPVSGTILNTGSNLLSTTFTPSDASNYNNATATVTLVVIPASATMTLSNLIQTYDGTPKPVTVITSPSNLSGVNITYNGSSTVPTNAGTYPVVATLTNANYTAPTVSGTLTINKANSILSWATPLAISFGTPLSSIQLNATSNTSGSFSYNYPIGTLLPIGNTALIATFTPDNSNYNVQTISVVQVVYGSPVINFYIHHGKPLYLNWPK